MDKLKIFICTTLRDFNNTRNDEIQKLFLKSIENQTYKNIELLISLFGEKNVQDEIRKYSFKSVFFQNKLDNYKYSHTSVVSNALKYANSQATEYILLWTTADVIYPIDFFEKVLKNYYNRPTMGTSHPHELYESITDFQNNKKKKNKTNLFSGFDLLYFDSKFLNNPLVNNFITNVYFYNWGIFEHFLISLNEFVDNVTMINLYEEVKCYKIENNRKLTNETNNFLVESHKINSETFLNFLKENKITLNYFDLAFCNLKFKTTKSNLRYYLYFSTDILQYLQRKVYRGLSSLIPANFKRIFKK